MKPLLLFALMSVFAFTACQKQEQTSNATEDLKLFEKGRGLRLPEQTCQMIGLETVEVTEKPFRKRVEVSAQVYESGEENAARALASLRAEQSKVLKEGMPVTLFAPGSETNAIIGALVRVENFGTHAEALLEFADPNRRFPAGSFLRALLIASETHTALAVPEASVVHGAEGSFVYAVNGAHFTRTAVKIGSTENGFTEILDGLYAGDSVASKAVGSMWMIELYALKGGTPCCPVPKKNTAAN